MSWSVRLLVVVVLALGVGIGVSTPDGSDWEASATQDCADPGSALPVVVVHGFRSNAAAMSDLVSTLEDTQIDVAVETFDYGEHSTTWVTHEKIGPKLRHRLICLADASLEAGGLGRVVVVGHSMGGLAARYALSTDEGDGRGVLADEIAFVATVGTPHEGSVWGRAARQLERGLQSSLTTQMWGRPLPLAGTPAGGALATGSSQLAQLPQFPDGVPVLALASEYVGQPRFLFFRPPEVRVGDAVVSRSSALALSSEIDGMGGSDEITCRIDLPLDVGMHSINAAVSAELLANPAVRDCGHLWQHTAHRLTGEINVHIAVAANQTPRERRVEKAEADTGETYALTVSDSGVGDLDFGTRAEETVSAISEVIDRPNADTGWIEYFELQEEGRSHGLEVEGMFYRTPYDDFDWYWSWPWYRKVCWQALCLKFGGESAESAALRGWTLEALDGEWVYDEEVDYPPDPWIAIEGSGITLGSTWQDVQQAFPQATLGIGEGGGLHINDVWADWQWRISARHDFSADIPTAPPDAQVTYLTGGDQRGFPCC